MFFCKSQSVLSLLFLYLGALFFVCSFSLLMGKPQKAIVIGASSGMGREVARLLSKEGYSVGLVARRLALLQSLQEELLPHTTYIKQIDVTNIHARELLKQLIEEMGGVDLVVISLSAYLDNKNAQKDTWEERERTIDVTGKGFLALAEVAFEYFERQNSGHFVGISSTSGLWGYASNPIYSAVKAAISAYMEGKRGQMIRDRRNITVTDVIPGFVAVEHSLLGQDPTAYWEITTEQAGKIILAGIKEKKDIVYVPWKVCLLNLFVKLLPRCIY
jgi:short-subunit dehydrogenase